MEGAFKRPPMDEGDTRSAVGLWRGEPAQPLIHHPVWRQDQALLAARSAAATGPTATATATASATASATATASAATSAAATAAASARVELPAAAPAAPAPEVRYDAFLAALRSAGGSTQP